MLSNTSSCPIAVLRRIVSYFGLPEHVVTNTGSRFRNAEFQIFLYDNFIERTTTSHGHPATNGMAERYVGELKDKLSKMGDPSGEPLQTKLDRFLVTYKATPISFGKSPPELMMSRQPTMRLSILNY